VPDFDVVQTDGLVKVRQSCVEAFFGDNVVTRGVGVASIDAGCDGHYAAETINHLGHFLEAASEGEFGSGGVFYQDCQAAFRQIESLRCGSNCGSSLKQASFPIGPSG